MMTAAIPPPFRPLQFKRTLSGVWAAYPLPDYALTIRCAATGYVFRGVPYPDYPAAVAAANTWWADQLRDQIVNPTPERNAA